ncbi:MAG: DUF4399 domain-containing protein [Pseudomonadota bacterium]
MRITHLIVAAALGVSPSLALAGETPSPEGAETYFIGLEDGTTVSNPVTLRFGARNIGIAPAGVEWPDTGHHHLIINEAIEGAELSEPIPADDQHRHFGGGQTEVTLDLPAGTHTIQLVMGDHDHIPHDPPVMSERITITVK